MEILLLAIVLLGGCGVAEANGVKPTYRNRRRRRR